MSPLSKFFHRSFVFSLLVLSIISVAGPAFAATTGVAALYMPQGGGAATNLGDYVSAGAGLRTYYSYFIEVPPGTGQLHVDIFDADVGTALPAEGLVVRDFNRNALNTGVVYTLLNPAGGVVATATVNAGGCPTCDNAWATFATLPVNNPQAGHWELRVNMSRAAIANNGDDINAIGLRAHDGNPAAGGRELNVYFHSYNSYGIHGNPTSNSYVNYPYLTSGCTADLNEFDWDSNGSMTLASPFGLSSQTFSTLSPNDTWFNHSIAGWTTDSDAIDYGLWTLGVTITAPSPNYGVVYIGSSAAANPPPTAQPQANTFRIFLPNDAGTVPVKPYLEQRVRYVSGPNPPVAGMTTRVRVWVRVINPTPYAIAFSSTNVVTANVPGGLAVYAGSPAVSQGTVTSQPVIGAGGNVVWNPGTLAAGNLAQLFYDVNVTPAMAGQRVVVTGTPTSNGTTARYVDETANTTQARATYTWGPLCELAITVGQITHAVVEDFRLYEHAGRVAAQWRTTSEAGTLGFRLERRDGERWTRVGEELLVGLLHEPQGGTYRVLDEEAVSGKRLVYRLVEVETSSTERILGPFEVVAEPAPPDLVEAFLTGEEGYERAPRPLTASGGGQVETAEPPQLPLGRSGLWAEVERDGLVRVTAGEIATALAQPVESIRRKLERQAFELTVGGEPVAWWSEPGGEALRFYGQATTSPFARRNAYLLEPGAGLAAATLGAGSSAQLAPATQSFLAHKDLESDRFAAIALALDPRQDFWFWEVLSGGHPTLGVKTFTFDAPRLAAGRGAVTLRLQGASASGVPDEHWAEVEVNGIALGQTRWQGVNAHVESFDVPHGVLLETGNTLRITARRDPSVSQTIFYADGFELTWPQRYEAVGDTLAFSADGHPLLTVRGFSGRKIEVVEVSDPLRPRRVTGAKVVEVGGSFALSLVPSSASARYVATAAVAPAALVRPDEGIDLLAPSDGASGIVIAPTALLIPAERLAGHRALQGESVRVVSLQAVYDAFSDGLPDPEAIARLLSYSDREWREPPRWALLAGAGTYDYKNNLGLGGNLLPPRMVATSRGLYASDLTLGDVKNNDGVPEIAVGRLPVTTAAELDAYVDKVIGFETADGAGWAEKVVLLADDPDQQTDFGADSDRIAALLPPGMAPQKLYLAQTPAAAARTALFQAIAGGIGHLNYAGHGGADRLDHGLLFAADAAAMSNGGRAPLVTALTCTIGRFEIPGFEVLGEALVRRAGGGASAVFTASGVSVHADAERLGEQLFQALYRPETVTLGDALRQALEIYAAQGGSPEMLRIYNLLGDPGLHLKPLPELAPGTTDDR